MKRELLDGITRIVTHGNCPDGLASAMVLRDVLPAAKIEFVNHNTDNYDNLKATPGMIFCDIVPPLHRIDEFIDVNAIVLDHHISAKDIVLRFGERGVYASEHDEPGVSGAVLAFREVWLPLSYRSYIAKGEAEYFAMLAGIRDTWQKHSELWDESNYQSSILMFYDPDHWLNNSGFLSDKDYELGKIIYDNRIKKAKKIAKNCVRFSYNGRDIAVFNDSDKITSDVADLLKNENISIVAGFNLIESDNDTNLPKIIFSLRSCDDIDVSELAQWINPLGGGHTNAAGFSWNIKEDIDSPFTFFKDKVIKFLSECDV